MLYRRKTTKQTPHTEGEIENYQFDIFASAQKNLESEGKLEILDELSTAVDVGMGAIVRCWNNDDTDAHFVAIGTAAVAAPTGPSDGIAIPPLSYVTINTAENSYIRSDTADVFGYRLVIDTILVERTEDF